MISQSSKRLKLLESEEFHWDVIVEKLGRLKWDDSSENEEKPSVLSFPHDEDSKYHYVYICKKHDLQLCK